MPFEHDDLGLRIIGYNQPIRFYDNNRTLRAEIYLQSNNTLNVGGLTTGGSGSTSAGGTHGLGDLAIHTGTLANAQAPQFVLLDGTRPLTANWDAGDFRITAKTLASDVATGTAPLVVASTTAVSNLNADLLDGYEGAAFPRKAEAAVITGAWDFRATIDAYDILPATTDTYDLGSTTKLWRKGWLSELDTVIFAENTITLLGGWFYITKYAGTAAEDIDDSETQIDLGVSDSVLAAGDFICFRQSLAVEYMTLGSYVGSNVWNVTRNVDGSGANAWPQGAPFAVFGQAGDGRIELNAYDTPRISIVKQGAAYNAQTELIRMGDLNGLADYTAEEYGIFIGDYAGNKWLAYDQTNSLRIRGDALIEGTVDATKFTVGMADQFFSKSDGLLLLGPYDAITTTTWTSQRGQTATISGAFHQVAGPWPGTRALMVEEATTNYVPNPSFEVNTTGWASGADVVMTRTAGGVSGNYYLACSNTTGSGNWLSLSANITAANSETWSLSFYYRSASGAISYRIHEYGTNTAIATGTLSATRGWKRASITGTTPGSGTTGIRSVFYVDNGEDLDLDCVQLEKLGHATTYVDGSLAWGTWAGTAHNSTSGRDSVYADLNAHVGEINGRDELTLSAWVQPGLDYDEYDTAMDKNPFVFDAFADSLNRIYVYYGKANMSWGAFHNGVYLSGPVESFEAGQWFHLVLTHNATTNVRKFYVNGTLVDTNTDAFTPPAGMTYWILGSIYSGSTDHFMNLAFAEYAAFTKELSESEVAALYHRNAPLADAGAMDTPGIYILDGKFKIASSTAGTRIEITPEMIAGYSNATTKQFYLQASDGKAYAGGGAVMLDEDGILITTADLQENVIQFKNSDITLAAGVTGLLNLQSVDPNSNAYGAFNYGWATNDGNNRSLVSCWQYEIDFLIQKAGDYRYVLEANYDYIRTNAPLIVVAQSAEPSTGVTNGMLYYDTDTNKLMVRANGSWVALH